MVASWEYLEQILTVTVTVSCPSNICPGDICPYQEYLGFYWPDFDETLKVASWEHLEQILIKSDIALVNSNQTMSLTLAQPSLFYFFSWAQIVELALTLPTLRGVGES